MRDVRKQSRLVAVALGGAVGSTARWGVVSVFGHQSPFPWPVLLVNVAGSVLLGVLLGEEWSHPQARLVLHDFGGIGVCGGLTTFSTFSLEVVELARIGRSEVAAVYVAASLVSGLLGVAGGAAMLRRFRSLDLAVEGDQ